MGNKKIIRRSDKRLNIFVDGGDTRTWGQKASDALSDAFNSDNLAETLTSASGAVGTAINAGMNNAQVANTSSLENQIANLPNFASGINNNDELMDQWGTFRALDNVSASDIRGGSSGQRIANTLGSGLTGAGSGASIGGPAGAIVGGLAGIGSSIAGWITGNRKARRKARALNRQINRANELALTGLETKAQNIDMQNDINALANFAAYGGKLYASGGNIHIKPSKRGTFTAAAKKHGKSVQGFASQVLANKDRYSPAMVKKANFARNARKWKHEEGGPLDLLVDNINRRSSANFVQRLKDRDRAYISDWEYPSYNATHKLSYVTNGDNTSAIVYPEVQMINDTLHDYTNPRYNHSRWDALDNAILNRDTLMMSPDEAEMFTAQYKQYYPKGNTFRNGGVLYDNGGNLYTSIDNIGQHGGNFSNGVTIIGEGGTHEENPNNGVPIGIAPDGTPNLVEEGEIRFNNYIFSNRLSPDKDLLESVNLPAKYKNHSFADIAEKLSKESSERPNDPISKRGLMSSMTRLQQAQEQVRMEENRGGNKYAHGGKIGRKYDGEGDEPNLLQFYTPQERWLRTLQRQGIVPTYELPAFKKPYSMMTPEERTASFNLEVPSLVDTRTPAERWVDENIKPIQFNPSAITGDAGSDTDTEDPNTNSSRQGRGLTWLRYAPAVGAGLGVLTDALGWTNSPDYGNADLVGSAVDNLTNVEFTPIGNYLTYRPLDRNYYINKLNAQAGATRRAIVNQSGGNRATALAGLLAADYNAQSALGDLARQAEEYNFNQRKDVETFNRGTNQFNSEMGLKASIANQANDKLRLQARTTQAQLRDQADARSSAGRAANLTNLFDSLGEIGREEFSRNMIQTNPALYYSIDSSGRITYKNGYEDLSEAEKKVVRDAANKAKRKKKAKGGYLTIRKGK